MIKLQVLGFSMDAYLVLMKKGVDTSLTFMIISKYISGNDMENIPCSIKVKIAKQRQTTK
jgi:hypothetical protein